MCCCRRKRQTRKTETPPVYYRLPSLTPDHELLAVFELHSNMGDDIDMYRFYRGRSGACVVERNADIVHFTDKDISLKKVFALLHAEETPIVEVDWMVQHRLAKVPIRSLPQYMHGRNGRIFLYR